MKLRSISDAFSHGLVLQRVLDRLRRIGIDIDPFLVFVEGTCDVGSPPVNGEFHACRISIDDLASLEKLGSGFSTDVLRERLAKGHICIALKHAGRVVAYTWADTTEINDASCRTKLGPDEVYLYDAFTSPEYRGRGLAPLMRVRSYEALRALGRNTFLSISDYFNTPALKFKRKLGARVVRVCIGLRLGRKRLGVWTIRTYPHGARPQR